MDIKKTTQLQGVTDLTVMARVRPGLIPGAFNAVSYVHRLATVLRVLNSVRQASRESALQRSPFADSIGRFRAIHFFRFAVVPPVEQPADRHQLLLNVTFDGGWEPYMRLVWGPLGKLLDLIFCNCEGYPMASQCSFDEYVRWVRRQEVPSAFFYADSAASVADVHYLRALEELQWTGGRAGADACDAVGLAVTDPPTTTIPTLYAVTTSIRVLKALSALRDFFPSDEFVDPGEECRQDAILLRFTRDLLADLRNWIEQGMFDPGGAFDSFNAGFRLEREWLMSEDKKEPPPPERLTFNRRAVQAGLVEPYPDAVRHGVLVLARIQDVETAKKKWLANEPATPDDKSVPTIYRSVALTRSGLIRLRVPPKRLGLFPQEFRVGMEARAGLLGDLRGNHPDSWKRPTPNWPSESPGRAPIELSAVHVVLQLRAALDPVEETNSKDGTILVQRFIEAIEELENSGLRILHVQPMHTRKREEDEVAGRDHFGFVDGISQPKIPAVPVPSTAFWSDRVKTGDVFLGYANTRGDKSQHIGPRDDLLDNGTFLVIRKLAMYPERLDAVVAQAARHAEPEAGPQRHKELCEDIKARLMGRHANGNPTIKPAGAGKNDFIFKDDAAGWQCPHRSHIRRANPRTPLPGQPAPRIVRRGMSYTTPPRDTSEKGSRGLVFMAYNSSIAEQFEVIQRWLTGGNSSGLSSAHDDPFLGVPEVGQRRVYRYVHGGEVVQIDLGEEPLAELQWGLYAFVPSMAALKLLAAESIDEVDPGEPEEEHPPVGLEMWRARLEDENVRARTWAEARELSGGLMDGEEYGLLVGSAESVLNVLKDDGSGFSVCGYGDRMDESGIGRGFLGMDDVGPHAGHNEMAPEVNAAIEAITDEKAFRAAVVVANAYLDKVLALHQASTGVARGPLDVIEYGRRIMSELCTIWFGLPDGRLMRHGTKADDQAQADEVAHCPGHFLTASRYVFGPHPMAAVEGPARKHGERILKAVRAMLDEADAGKRELTDLVKAIANAKGIKGRKDRVAKTVAGVMLGFPPTVLGNLVTVLMKWIATGELWDRQLDLAAEATDEEAFNVLAKPFVLTMSENPVPYAVWRTAMTDHPFGKPRPANDKVIVGLGSAMADGGHPILMFGGAREPGDDLHTPHACPGYRMAMGVMLGSVTALLKRGALAATADPRVLILTGLVKPPAAPAPASAAAAASPTVADAMPSAPK